MNAPGQPTRYKAEYRELARKYCLLGATNEELGGFFGVTRRTIDNWIANVPEFTAAVRKGRALADARVARCLYERAVGYEHTVKRTVLHQGKEWTLTDVVHLPPDIKACIFWLRHRRPENWRERAEVSDDGVDDIALLDAASEQARFE